MSFRVWKALLLTLFFGAIYAPLASGILGAGPTETSENRELAALRMPETLEELHRFPGRFDAYIKDRFGLRPWLISGYYALKYHLKESGNAQVAIGRNGWLHLNHDPQFKGWRGVERFSDAELEHWAATLDRRRRLLAGRGAAFFVLIAPDKHSIYPETLPRDIPAKTRDNRFDQVVAYVRAHYPELTVVDPRPALTAAKERFLVYYPLDTHWTDYGAFIAYRELAGAIRATRPDFPRRTLDDYTPATLTGCEAPRDLLNMLELPCQASRRYPALRPKTPPAREVEYLTGARNWRAPHVVRTGNRRGPALFMIRDSFSLPLQPFIEPDFARIVYTHRDENTHFPLSLITAHRPDIVVLEIVERSLPQAAGDGDLP